MAILKPNDQNFDVWAYKSPTHTGLDCIKTLEPDISCLGPFDTCTANNFVSERSGQNKVIFCEE
jgi:hypothetical protein